jgi:hypothetical protein
LAGASILAGALGVAMSFLYLASASLADITAGTSGFVAGAVLIGSGVISLSVIAAAEKPGLRAVFGLPAAEIAGPAAEREPGAALRALAGPGAEQRWPTTEFKARPTAPPPPEVSDEAKPDLVQEPPEPSLAKVVRVLGRIVEQLPRLLGDLEELRATALDAAKEVAKDSPHGGDNHLFGCTGRRGRYAGRWQGSHRGPAMPRNTERRGRARPTGA